MADGKPIIVIKKKGGHGGHHGGAWKIAYADFVTAMMCFFMVMWLVNTATVVTRENIASYFRRPGLFEVGSGTPLMVGQTGILEDAFTPNKNLKSGSQGGKNETEESGVSGEDPGTSSSLGQRSDTTLSGPKAYPQAGAEIEEKKAITNKQFEPTGPEALEKKNKKGESTMGINQIYGEQDNFGSQEFAEFEKAAEEIQELLEDSPELEMLLGLVDVKLDADGLNIEIADSDKHSMFELGSAKIQPKAEEAFGKLGGIISKMENTIDIVGHTDARPFARGDRGYSNWELSADRANAARRALQKHGVDSARITSVVGMADKLLRNETDPLASVNRRISMKIRFKRPSATKLDSSQLNQIITNKKPLKNQPVKQGQGAAATTGTETVLDNPFLVGEEKPTAYPSPGRTKESEELDNFKPKDLIKSMESNSKKLIELPEAPTNTETPGSRPPPDNIFKSSPILGAPDPFDF
jgi:chemotaxis protein MotB